MLLSIPPFFLSANLSNCTIHGSKYPSILLSTPHPAPFLTLPTETLNQIIGYFVPTTHPALDMEIQMTNWPCEHSALFYPAGTRDRTYDLQNLSRTCQRLHSAVQPFLDRETGLEKATYDQCSTMAERLRHNARLSAMEVLDAILDWLKKKAKDGRPQGW